MIRIQPPLLALAVASAAAAPAQPAERLPDSSYRYEVKGEETIAGCKAHVVELTSQKWRGHEWRHWLSILVPPKVDHGDAAILFVTGGSNRRRPPRATSREALLLAQVAVRSRAVLAVLQQVPNQPLYDGLKEDDLIAHTFDEFLEGGDADWPLLLPMVESAVRAMDAVASVRKDTAGVSVDRFVVSGASKRGWTTWLTAAADPRVVAIAPMVIDVLNMRPQMDRQLRTYGEYSDQIEPYTSRRIPERMDSERGRALTRLVDPFERRESLTMPKLVVLGTNDPYWTVDASSLYFPQLPGAKNLFYLPNAGHGLGAGIVPTVVAFFRASLDGTTLPQLSWRVADDTLRVEWQTAGGKAKVWRARSPTRDFREARWESTPLEGSGSCAVGVPDPAAGWSATFVEVRFRADGGERFGVATEIVVRPERFPFEGAARRTGR